jgi:hypothetical protein
MRTNNRVSYSLGLSLVPTRSRDTAIVPVIKAPSKVAVTSEGILSDMARIAISVAKPNSNIAIVDNCLMFISLSFYLFVANILSWLTYVINQNGEEPLYESTATEENHGQIV